MLRGRVWRRRVSLVLHGHEGPRRDGAVTGGWAAQPPPAQCQAAGATSYMGSCPGAPQLSPGRGAGRGMEHPHCSQGSASPVSTSSTRLTCALSGLVLPHPCFRGAGAKRPPSFRGGQKRGKTSLSPCAPWGWQWLELPCKEGVSLRTGVQQGQTAPAQGGGPAPGPAAAPGAPQGGGAQVPAGTPAQLPGGGRVPLLPLWCCGTKLFITLNYLFIVLERQLLFMTLGPRGPGVI